MVAFPWEDSLLSVLLVGYAVWWAYDLRRGTVVRRSVMALHIAVYLLLFLWVLIVGTVFVLTQGGLPLSTSSLGLFFVSILAVWVVFVGVFYYASRYGYRLGLRRLVVDRTSTGKWVYRGLVAFPILWLLLWLVRLGLEATLLGGYSVFIPTTGIPSGVPVRTFLAVGLGIEALYFISFGLMVGITIAAWANFRRLKKAGPAPWGPPPPVSPTGPVSPR